MKIALLGAESTGKTQLAGELAAHLRQQGKSIAVVPEVLREWCHREGRTPRPEEQLPIAQEQERRVDEAGTRAEIVIADTTALMVAIYSAMLFEDGTLYQFALDRQRSYDVTLLTGLDLPWIADGLQRDGAHVREPVDALIRAALARAKVPYRLVYGSGEERLANALAAIGSATPSGPPSRPWAWSCDKCSDPDCEHRLFTGLLGKPNV
ncbi:ATP-binding protein [Caenimonas soli]|uniref:ATP-binding protein n=1 Tax=Caenimonas soli TaxID=2735555 RepID=UPI002E289312|nr:ATP-binding protein [Caenimonas soli]